jgi:hypothetical protein
VGEPDKLQLPQDRETPVQALSRKGFAYRYAYARSAESRDAHQPGQDYLVLCEDDQRLVFALCDGVGESFYGDLAASFLGDRLAEWLWNEVNLQDGQDTLRALLRRKLLEWTGPASELVASQALPPGIPALQHEALENKRALGSQSTFVCGRLDLPSSARPAGGVFFAWLGDSRLRIWSADRERTQELGDTFDAAQRWSTSRGAIGGEPHVFAAPLLEQGRALAGFMVYSDGLAALDRVAQPLLDQPLQELIDDSQEAATSDDASFLEVWIGRAPAWAAIKALPAPKNLRVAFVDERIAAGWQSVAGATQYEVELDGQRQTSLVTAPEWLSPQMAPGTYRARVRAWRSQQAGEWSAWHSMALPELPITRPTALPVTPAAAQQGLKETQPAARPARQRALAGAVAAALVLLAVSISAWFLTGTPRSQTVTPQASPSPIGARGPESTASGGRESTGTAAMGAQATAESQRQKTAVQSQQTALPTQLRGTQEGPRLMVAPVLEDPVNGAELPAGRVVLRWSWDGGLAQNQCYAVRVSKDGQPLYKTFPCTRDREHELWLISAGEYHWSIVVVQPAGTGSGSGQAQDVSRESERWSFTLAPAGGQIRPLRPSPSPTRTPKI